MPRGTTEERRQRAMRMLLMRRRHKTWGQIGLKFKMDPSNAHHTVKLYARRQGITP